jgi:hypothetical protein
MRQTTDANLALVRRTYELWNSGGAEREFRAHFDARQARREYERLCGEFV